jgi:hypothetical protein
MTALFRYSKVHFLWRCINCTVSVHKSVQFRYTSCLYNICIVVTFYNFLYGSVSVVLNSFWITYRYEYNLFTESWNLSPFRYRLYYIHFFLVQFNFSTIFRKFKAVHSDDLFRNLDLAAAEDNRLPDGITVKGILDTWTLQRGHPLVRVGIIGPNMVNISQVHT